LAWEAISHNDFPVVQAVVLLISLVYIVLTLLADVATPGSIRASALAERMSNHAATFEATVAESFAGPSPGELLRRRIRGHAGLLIGAGVLALIALMAFAAPWLAPQDPFAQDLARRLIPPVWHETGTWTYPLGTDMLGRDYLSRVIYGSRISLLIGFSVMIISGVIGAVLGIVAAISGGRTDLVVTYLITVRLSLPVDPGRADHGGAGGQFAVDGDPGAGAAEVGPLRRGAAERHAASAQPRLRHRRARHRLPDLARHRGEVLPNVSSHLIVVATLEMGSADPARGRALLPRSRRAAAAAVLGPDDLGGERLYVLQPVADHHPGLALFAAGARDQSARRRGARRNRARGRRS